MRFDKRGKLCPRYIGTFEILERVGMMVYKLALPPNLCSVHPVFHMSMLNGYHGDGNYIIRWDSIILDKDLLYEDGLIALLIVMFKNSGPKRLRWSKFNRSIVQLRKLLG